MAPGRDTARLKAEQRRRERAEKRMAETTPEPVEAVQHARRADKAAYLQSKLSERERSERRGD